MYPLFRHGDRVRALSSTVTPEDFGGIEQGKVYRVRDIGLRGGLILDHHHSSEVVGWARERFEPVV